MRFRHITNREGLKYTWVWNISEDSDGYMWFSTMYGAYRYNGFDFEEYSFVNRGDSVVASVNFVFEDSSRRLWFGTGDGLYRYDRRYNKYTHYTTESTSPSRLSSLYIADMVEDGQKNLWVATYGGLDRIAPDGTVKSYHIGSPQHSEQLRALSVDSREVVWAGTNQGTVCRYDIDNDCFVALHLSLVINSAVLDIFEDSKHNIWIGTSGDGVVCYDIQRNSFIHYSTSNRTLSNDIARSIVEDSDGNILIGTEKGIVICNLASNEFVFSSVDDPWSLNDNAIYTMCRDSNDNLWVGTFFGGVNVLYRQFNLFDLLLSTSEEYQANSKVVSSISRCKEGIMVGTENSGIYCLDWSGKRLEDFNSRNSGFRSDNIHTICIDNHDNLWVGSYQGGLYMRPKDTNRFEILDKEKIGSDNIYCVRQDSRGNLWVGTQYGGLVRYNYQAKTFERFPESLPHSLFVWDILEDRVGNIWLACYGEGIYRLSAEHGYVPEQIDAQSTHNFITLCELSDGRILVGTEKEGMVVVDPLNLNSKILNEHNGLPDNTIYGILQDDRGNVWFSSNSGLSKADVQLEDFTTYTIADGLPTNRFNYNACAKIDGRLYFGSTNGVVVVNPDNEKPIELNRPIRFGNFYLNNRKEKINPKGILTENINSIDRLSLRYNQNTFSVDFSSNILGYNFIQNFAYRMEGLDNKWHNIGAQHRVDFMGLAPGNYTLSVCTLDHDVPMTTNVSRLRISIKPVWWQSTVAKVGFWVLFLLVAAYVVYVFVQTSKHRHALELEKLAREKDKEINEMKFRFFVNISHEFKTPLSLILGPIELFINNNVRPEQTARYFGIIKKNADKLLGLINELLAFRELQFAKLTVSSIETGVFIESVLTRYSWLFEEKQVKLSVEVSDSCAMIEADADKLEKIFDNLLSNAYKHTPQEGTVAIKIIGCNKNAVITVMNTGEGIAAEKLPYIFDRFFTGQSYDKYSSGVGLSYVKSLVELHGGSITAHSELGRYTSIEFTLPISQPQKTSNQSVATDSGQYNVDAFNEHYINFDNQEPEFDLELYARIASETTLLFVEDDNSMRELLVDFFSPHYTVMSAENSEVAAQIVHENKVDIVVSDVMMIGGMSGFDLCHYLKSNIETSHVKVILMTVLSENDYKYQGYRSGADTYIVKPFEFSLLELRIKNMVINTYKMREVYKINIDLSNINIATSNSDEQLVRKLVDVIFEHLSDSEFSVENLCWQVGMSKATLYRKLKAITGQSINEFIQNTRLKYAARLLKQTDKPVSDIGYDVGFADPYYFSRSFKKCFGLSPKQWREAHSSDSAATE